MAEKWATAESDEESDAAVVLRGLSRIEPYFEQLRKSALRPRSRYPGTWSLGFKAMPEYSNCLAMGRWLELKTVAELEAGKSEEALADWRLTAALARSLQLEPSMLACLVDKSIRAFALNAIGEGLDRRAWPDSALLEFEKELATWNALTRTQYALKTERAFMVEGLDDLARTGDVKSLFGPFGPTSDVTEWYLYLQMKRKGWWRKNQLWLSRNYDEILQELDAANERWRPASARKHDHSNIQGFWAEHDLFVAKTMAPTMESWVTRALYEHAMFRLTGLACALERFHRARGAYPEKLDELVPGILSHLPHDPCTGTAFIYRRDTVEGYLLYSVGENQKDDNARKGEGRVAERSWPDWRWWAPTVAPAK